jgi:hypothetical protein
MKKIAIHQPNLFPWLGYFHKIKECDAFIFLDHTLNNKNEATYTRRVQLLNSHANTCFVTIPVVKSVGTNFSPINSWQINTNQPGFPSKILRTIEHSYCKHPYYDEIFPLVEAFFIESNKTLASRNIDFITSTCKLLEIDKPFYLSSELNFHGNGTELLISLVKSVNGDVYISGKGGNKYQDPKLFSENRIELIYTSFKHPVYNQKSQKEFIPGLSILDALFNLGISDVKRFYN